MSDEVDLEIELIGRFIYACHDPKFQPLSPEGWDRVSRYAEALLCDEERKATKRREDEANASMTKEYPELMGSAGPAR